MLIELRVSNFKSIKDEQVLSMAASRGSGDSRVREVAGSTRLLPVVAIYGANASGKSNVLDALAYMQEAVLYSHRFWPPEGGTNREPFAWENKSKDPSLFEILLVVDGVRYQYGFIVDDESFVEEWLHAWPSGRKQIWYERKGDQFKFGEHLLGENRVVEQITRPNALYLSAAVQNRHEQLSVLFSWFNRLRTRNMESRRFSPFRMRSTESLAMRNLISLATGPQRSLFGLPPEESGLHTSIIELLKNADVGIVDLKVEAESDSDASPRSPRSSHMRVFFKHQSVDDDAWLPLEKESQGTRTLFNLAHELLSTLNFGGTLVVDELERSLHPLLALWIVNQFNRVESNPKDAQLIFSTHDTNLLGTTVSDSELRRDQVWLTEKDAKGVTCLYPLTNYKARKSENLERGYLQGRYGAIPILGDSLDIK